MDGVGANGDSGLVERVEGESFVFIYFNVFFSSSFFLFSFSFFFSISAVRPC